MGMLNIAQSLELDRPAHGNQPSISASNKAEATEARMTAWVTACDVAYWTHTSNSCVGWATTYIVRRLDV